MKKFSFLIAFFALCLFSKRVDANEVMLQSLQQSLQDLKETVQSLQSTIQSQNEVIRQQTIRIDALEQQKGLTPNVPQSSGISVAGVPKTAGVMGFNPDIGVTGTVQAKMTEDGSDGEGNDTIALKELELNFAQVVDPFSRLDAIIAFNDNLENQNVDIEEAYYTRWGLPFGFTGQIGKFRAKIGKQNLQHLHQLDTVNYPLVIQDFFGDEGLASSGARLQNSIPNPWDIPFEITGEILRGNNGNSFSGISRRPIFNTHAKTYFDVSKDTNVEFGWTTLFGDENPATLPEGQDRYGVKVFGGDMTWNWFLAEGRKLKWQNEIYFQNRGNMVHINDNPWGFYSLLDLRFSPRYSIGIRFDYVEPLNVVRDHLATTGISPYFTFWQSEFADFRLQFSHTDPASANAKSDNAIYLSANFLIGAHKHPVQ